MGDVVYDILYGGCWYAWIDAEPLGLEINFCHKSKLIDAGRRIRTALKDVDLQHPTLSHMKSKGKVVETVKLGHFDAVIPHIGGRTFITGFNTLVLEKEDFFRFGWSEDGLGLAV